MDTPQKEKNPPPLGRYIRNFTLRNVRTFRSPAKLDFCFSDGRVAQWTIILGENGTGKTTLLQYLAGLLPVQDKELTNQVVGKNKRLLGFRPVFATQEWFGWHAENLPRPWSKPMELEASVELSSATSDLKSAIAPTKRTPFGLKISIDEKDSRPSIQITFTGTLEEGVYEQFRLFGYGAGRHVAGPASPYLSSASSSNNSEISPIFTLFHDDQPLISPEQWLLGLDHSLARSEGASKRVAKRALDSARRCLKNSLPDIEDIQIKPYGILAGQTPLTVLCKTPFNPQPVPFGTLSVGYRTMSAWITDFVKRMHEEFPQLKQPDNGPAIVLIDEFDLHMHPRWQRAAMAEIGKEFPNTQFIVTVHSPIAVQAAGNDAKILLLRRQPYGDGTEEIIVESNPHHISNWSLEQIVEGLYGVSTRPPKYDELMRKRVKLRQKANRTQKENETLVVIESELKALEPDNIQSASNRLLDELKKAISEA